MIIAFLLKAESWQCNCMIAIMEKKKFHSAVSYTLHTLHFDVYYGLSVNLKRGIQNIYFNPSKPDIYTTEHWILFLRNVLAFTQTEIYNLSIFLYILIASIWGERNKLQF